MTSQQYEELCRYFISCELDIRIDRVESRRIANPQREPYRPGEPAKTYKHQIDLYWEVWDRLGSCINIANAKWRGKTKVGLHDILLLQKVREKIGAHRAFLITNSDFSRVAIKAAVEEGIGLIVVRPDFRGRLLQRSKRHVVQRQLSQLGKEIWRVYTHFIYPGNYASRGTWLEPRLGRDGEIQ